MKLELVLKEPVLTEKAVESQEKGCYQFWVDVKANKFQIAAAVEKFFNVKPLSVRTARLGDRKKAFVQLPEGEEISFDKLGEEDDQEK